ncbi:MAG: hypothetical protein AAF267_20435, partial [Deinococcota bacterium]
RRQIDGGLVVLPVLPVPVRARLILTYVDQLEELTSGLPMIELPTLVNRSLYAIASQYPQEALRLYQRTLQPLDILLP